MVGMDIVPGEHIPMDKISAGKMPAVQAAAEVKNGMSIPRLRRCSSGTFRPGGQVVRHSAVFWVGLRC